MIWIEEKTRELFVSQVIELNYEKYTTCNKKINNWKGTGIPARDYKWNSLKSINESGG